MEQPGGMARGNGAMRQNPNQEEPDTMNDVIEGFSDIAGTELEESGFYGELNSSPLIAFPFVKLIIQVPPRTSLSCASFPE